MRVQERDCGARIREVARVVDCNNDNRISNDDVTKLQKNTIQCFLYAKYPTIFSFHNNYVRWGEYDLLLLFREEDVRVMGTE